MTPLEDPVREHILAARASGAFLDRWREIAAPTLEGMEIVDAKAIQTHYVPGRSGRLVFEGGISRREGHRRRRYFTLQTYPTAGRAHRRIAASASRKRPLSSSGPSTFAIPDWNAVVWELPNGPRLRGLRTFMQRKALRRFLRRSNLLHLAEPKLFRPRLLRYVPRKRALFRWKHMASGRLELLFIKVFAPGDDLVAVQNLQAVSSPSAGLDAIQVPSLYHVDESRRALFMTNVPGKLFTERYGDAEEDDFRAVGEALAGFHASAVMPQARWTLGGELAALERAMADVTKALPSTIGRVTKLLEKLRSESARLEEIADRPIHGNLFGDQILLGEGGVGMVDWDDLTWGDPMFDLGRLLAHMIYRTADGPSVSGDLEGAQAALVEAYERTSDTPAPRGRLRFHIACGLLMRMKIDALRKLPADWCERVGWTIDRAEGFLEPRGGAGASLHPS